MNEFSAPRIIHFTAIGPLKSERLDYIAIWAKANPDYKIKLWGSEEYSIDKFLFRIAYEKERTRQPSELKYHQTGISSNQRIWKRIDQGKALKPTNERYRDYVLRTITDVNDRTRFESLISSLDDAKQKLRLINNIQLYEFNKQFNQKLSFEESAIIKNSLNKSDSGLAEYLFGLKALNSEGGLYLASTILPEINTNLFGQRSGSDNSEPVNKNEKPEEIELLKSKLILRKLFSAKEINTAPTIELNEFPSVSVETYKKLQTTINDIGSIDNASLFTRLFRSLGDIRIKDDQILLGERTTSSLSKPVVLVAKANSGLVNSAILELSQIFRAVYINTASGIVPADREKASLTLRKYYLDRKTSITKNEFNTIFTSAFNLSLYPCNEYRVNSELFGLGALKRIAEIRKANTGTFKPDSFEQYSSETPEQKSIIKSHDFTKVEIFKRTNYDSFVVIAIGEISDAYTSNNNYYINNRIPERSAFLSYDSDTDSLVTERDKLPRIGENTKIVIAGHGVPESAEAEKVTVGQLSPEQLAAVLKKVIPDGITVRKISFIACPAALGVTGKNGIVTAGQKFFIPELLRKMAQKNIFTQEATGSNQAVNMTRSGNRRHWFQWDNPNVQGPNKAQDWYLNEPGLTRYTFRLTSDRQNVAFSAKPGIASYEPAAYAIRPNPPQGVYPLIFPAQRDPEYNLGNNYLYESIDKALSRGMSSFDIIPDRSPDRIVVANKDETVIYTMLRILKLSSQSPSYSQWLDAIKKELPGHQQMVESLINSFSGDELKNAAFSRIKERFARDVFDFYVLDYTTRAGAAVLNYRYRYKPFDFIQLPDQHPSSRRRSRRTPTESDARAREIAHNLGVISSPNTQLTTVEDTEIIWMNTSDQPARAVLQKEYNTIRRQKAMYEASYRRGWHNFIVMDDTSFAKAQVMAQEAGEYVRIFKLRQTHSCGLVLISSDNKVNFALEGGKFNGLTLVGGASTLTTQNLAAVANMLAAEGKIKQLVLAGMNINALLFMRDSLPSLTAFITDANSPYAISELIIQPDDSEPKSLRRLIQHFEDIPVRLRRKKAVKSIIIRNTKAQDPEYHLHQLTSTAVQRERQIISYELFSPSASLPRQINIVKLGALNVVDFVFLYTWNIVKYHASSLGDIALPLSVHLYIDSTFPYLNLLDRHISQSSRDLLLEKTGRIDKQELKKVAFDLRKQLIVNLLKSDGSLDIQKLKQLALDKAGKSEFNAIEKQHGQYLESLKRIGVDVIDIAASKNNPAALASPEKGYNLYSKLAYDLGSREMAERVIRSYLVVNKGGFTVQSGVFPSVNRMSLSKNILKQLKTPYLNRSIGASFIGLIAGILKENNIIPALSDQDLSVIEFYQTSNSLSELNLANDFLTEQVGLSAKQKDLNIIKKFFSNFNIDMLDRSLLEDNRRGEFKPVYSLNDATNTNDIDYILKNAGVVISMLTSGIKESVVARQLAFLESLFAGADNNEQLLERLNEKSQTHDTERHYINLISQACLREIIQSGSYGTPVNQIDFQGMLLSRSAYKNIGGITRGASSHLNNNFFLYYDYDNQIPETPTHLVGPPTKRKIILLIDQSPDAVASAWEVFREAPQSVAIYTVTWRHTSAQPVYGFLHHTGVLFTPNDETEFEVYLNYSSIKKQALQHKEIIFKFVKHNMLGISNEQGTPNSAARIIKNLKLNIKDEQFTEDSTDKYPLLVQLKQSLDKTTDPSLTFQATTVFIQQRYGAALEPGKGSQVTLLADIQQAPLQPEPGDLPVENEPLRSQSVSSINNQPHLLEQSQTPSSRKALETFVNADGSGIEIKVLANGAGFSELVVFDFRNFEINKITLLADNEPMRKVFKNAFSAALSYNTYSTSMDAYKTIFQGQELPLLKTLNRSNFTYKTSRFRDFFSTAKGKVIARSFLSSAVYESHVQKPRLMLMAENRTPLRTNLRCTVNEDGSLNIKLIADVFGLKELMTFKLYDYEIRAIDAYSDNRPGWEGFKFALDTAVKETRADEFSRVLHFAFGNNQLAPLIQAGITDQTHYQRVTASFRNFFKSEKGHSLLEKLTEVQEADQGLPPARFREQQPHLSQADLSGQGRNLRFTTNEDGSMLLQLEASAPALKDLILAKLDGVQINEILVSGDRREKRSFLNAFIIALKAETLEQLLTPLNYIFDSQELAPFHKLSRHTYRKKSHSFRSFFQSPHGRQVSASIFESMGSVLTEEPPVIIEIPQPPEVGSLAWQTGDPQSTQLPSSFDEQLPLVTLTPDNFFDFVRSQRANIPESSNSQTTGADKEASSSEDRGNDKGETTGADKEVSSLEDRGNGKGKTAGADKGGPLSKKARLDSSRGSVDNFWGESLGGSMDNFLGDLLGDSEGDLLGDSEEDLSELSVYNMITQEGSELRDIALLPDLSKPQSILTTESDQNTRTSSVSTSFLSNPEHIQTKLQLLKFAITQLQEKIQTWHQGGAGTDEHLTRQVNDSLTRVKNILEEKEGKNIWLMMIDSEKQSLRNAVTSVNTGLDRLEQSEDPLQSWTFGTEGSATNDLGANVAFLDFIINDLDNVEAQRQQQLNTQLRSGLDLGEACSSSGRRRRDTRCSRPDPSQVKQKINRFVDWLLRRSDNPRAIITLPGTGYPGMDIGTLPTRPNSLLAKIQARLKSARARKADAGFNNRPVYGFHTIVALDEDSWLAAQQQQRRERRPGTEVLLYKPASGILMSPYGQAITRIPGGAYNSLAFVGKLGEANVPKISAVNRLNAFVNHFCHQHTIGSVLLQNTDGSDDAFKAFIQTFTKRPEGSFSRIGSLRFQSAHERNAPEFILRAHESTVLRLSSARAESTTHPRLDPVAYQRLEQIIKLNGLKNKVTPPNTPLLSTANNVPVASQLAEKRIKAESMALAFTDFISSIYQSHQLTDDYIPMLNTLKKTDQGWSMDFVHSTTGDKKATSFTSNVPQAVKNSFGRTKTNKAMRAFSRNVKKLVRTGSTTEKGLVLLSITDTAQMIAARFKSGSILATVDRAPWMSESVHESLQAQAFINQGLSVIESTELVQDLVRLSKSEKVKLPAKAGGGLKVAKIGKIPALRVGLHTGPQFIKTAKSLKLLKGLKIAGKLTGPALSLASASLTTYAWSEIEDPDIKSVHEKMVIVEWTGFAVNLIAAGFGPIGAFIAVGYAIFSLFFGSYLTDEMQEIMDKRTREAIGKVNEFFKGIYDQLDPDFYLQKGYDLTWAIRQFAPDLIPVRTNPPVTLIDLVSGTLKDSSLQLGFREIDLINHTLKMARLLVGTYDLHAYISHSSNGPSNDGDETSSTFTKRGEADLIAAYLKSDCRLYGGRLYAYGCQDGRFRLNNFLEDAKNIVLPVMPDYKVDLNYIDSNVAPPATMKAVKLFNEASKTNSKINFRFTSSVRYRRSTSGVDGGKDDWQWKDYHRVLVGVNSPRYLETNTTVRLNDKNYNLIFPYSKEFVGKVNYQISVPKGSKALQTLLLLSPPPSNETDTVLNLATYVIREAWRKTKLVKGPNTVVRHVTVNTPQNTPAQWFIRSSGQQSTYHCTEHQSDKNANCKVHFDSTAGQLTIDLTEKLISEKVGEYDTLLTNKLVFTGYWPGSDASQQYRINIVDKHALLVISPHLATSGIQQKEMAELKELLISKENWQRGLASLGNKILNSPFVKPFLLPEGRRERYDVNELFSKVSKQVKDYVKSPHIKVQLLYSSRPLTHYGARLKEYRLLFQRFAPLTRFLPVKLQNCRGNVMHLGKWVELTKNKYNCFIPDAKPAMKGKLQRTSLWFDTEHNVEIFLFLPTSAAGMQVIPIGGSPADNYFFYVPKKRKIYPGHIVNTEFKRAYQQRHTLFYQNPARFPYPVRYFAPIHKSETTKSGTSSYLVTTEKGVAFTLSAQSPKNIQSNAIYISVRRGSMAGAFSQLKQHKGILPLYTSKTNSLDDINSSGFYDSLNKVAMTYRSSLFDLPNPQSNCGANGTAIDEYWRPAFNAAVGLLDFRFGSPSNECVNNRYNQFYLKITPTISDTLLREHIPLHRFRQGEDVFYVMLSGQSKDLYYAKFHQPEGASDRVDFHKSMAFNIIALNDSHKDRLRNQQDGPFIHISSQSGGMLARTDSGMVIHIPNESLVRSSTLAQYDSAEAYQFHGWVLHRNKLNPFVELDKLSHPLNYKKLPRVNGASLKGLDLGLIAQKVYRQSFGQNSTPAPTGSPASKEWKSDQAKTFIDNLKIELARLYDEFEGFGFTAPDLVGLPVLTELKETQLAFLKQQEFWFDTQDHTLFMLPKGSRVEFVGRDANGLVATSKISSESSKKTPWRFWFSPAGFQDGHPYCGSAPFFTSSLPAAFTDKISPACRYSADAPEADYQWNALDNVWLGKYHGFLFELSENHRRVTGYDLNKQSFAQTAPVSYGYPGLPEGSSFQHQRQHLASVMETALGTLADTPLANFYRNKLLSLDLASNMPGEYAHTGWYDSEQKQAFIGPVSSESDGLTLIGSRISDIATKSQLPEGFCFNQNTGLFYRISHDKVIAVEEFDELSVIDNGKGLLVVGTSLSDQLMPSMLHLDTLYTDDESRLIKLRTDYIAPNDLSILLDGKQGTDDFVLVPSDLRYFKQVIISLNRDAGNSENPNRIQIRSPAWQFVARRQGHDLILMNRFRSNTGVVLVKQAWPGLEGRSPAPTQLIFSQTHEILANDRRLWLSQLVDDVARHGEVLFPLVIDDKTPVDNVNYHTLSPTPEKPILMDLAAGFRAIPTASDNASDNSVAIHFSKRDKHGAYNDINLVVTLKWTLFASGNVLIRQPADLSPANRVHRLFQFDNSKDCHLCTSDLHLKHSIELQNGEGRFHCNKPYPLSIGVKYIKCVAEQPINAGYPLITQKQLRTPGFSIRIRPETRVPYVLLEKPETNKRQPVYAVFYNINEPGELRFSFHRNGRTFRWEAWQGQVLIRSGVLSSRKNGINIKLIDNRQQHHHYRVIAGSVNDIKLHEQPGAKNKWLAEPFNEHLSLGHTHEQLPDFGSLQPGLLAALLKKWRGLDGVIMADGEKNQLVSLSRLAFMLNHVAPVLTREPSANGSAGYLMRGNSLDNILYCQSQKKPTKIRGQDGNDLLMLAFGTPVFKNLVWNFRANDYCNSLRYGTGPVNIFKGGAGDDIYDLRAPVNVKAIDSTGQHSVFLSSASSADLRQLAGINSLTVYLTDMTPEQVKSVLCNQRTGFPPLFGGGSNSQDSLLSGNYTLKLMSRKNSDTIALLTIDTLRRVYFQGSQVSLNPRDWITGADQSIRDSSGQTELRGMRRLLEGARNLVRRLLPESQQALSDEVMTSGKTGYPAPPSKHMANGEIHRNINTLIQAMSQFGAQKSSASWSTAQANTTMATALNVTSPLANTTLLNMTRAT